MKAIKKTLIVAISAIMSMFVLILASCSPNVPEKYKKIGLTILNLIVLAIKLCK